MLKWLLILLMFTGIKQPLTAQVAYHNFNTTSGLPSNETYCAFQDKDGYMWFGTDHGVARYNGYDFKVYTTDDGLTDNTVFRIKEDKNGNLWFLTLSGGICYYNGNTFHPHPMNDTITALCRRRLPTSWEVMDNKLIWLGFIQQGYVRVDTTRMVEFKPTPAYLGTQGTCVEISVVNIGQGRFIHSMFSNAKMVNVSGYEVTGKESYIYDCWFNKEVTLNFNMIQLSDRRILTGILDMLTVLTPKERTGQLIWDRDKSISNVKRLNNGEIWLTFANSPAYRVNIVNDKPALVDSLCFNSFITDVFVDKQGSYWVTSLDKGVYIIQNMAVRIYSDDEIKETQKIRHLTVRDNELYISLPANSLLQITDSSKRLIKSVKKDPVAPTSIAFTSQKKLITNLDSILHTDKNYKWILPDFYFLKLLELGNDEFLAGGGGGFVIWKDYNVVYNSQNYGFSKRVSDLCHITPEKILVGTNTGLHYFIRKKNKYTILNDTLLPVERVTACHVFKPTLYAIGTRGKGVLLYKDEYPYFINEENGLVSNLAEDVFIENDSILWVATYQGLAKVIFSVINGKINVRSKCYTTADGLSSNQINVIEKYNNKIWVGTNQGLCYFPSNALPEKAVEIPLYITEILVNGKFVPSVNSLLSDENNIFFKFNSLYYKSIDGIQYKIRLKGEGKWAFTNQQIVQYYGLPAGDYVFQVAAEDKFGRYISPIKELNFTINPRFTDTFQFKAIIGLIIVLVIASIIYILFAYQRFKARNVIRLLQSEFKALNYQINPHFIFNVLNSIQYYIIRKDSDKAVHFLNSFSTLIRRIVSNSRQQYISVIEEIECLKDYLDLEKLRLENKFDYELNIDSSVDIEKKMLLPMVIQPLVENSIWHGIVPLDGRGKIKVDFTKDTDGALICIVDDNGVGINSSRQVTKKEQNNLSLAMSNVNERLKIIGELNGSEWFINFKDKSELGNNEHGTRVTIRFPKATN